MKSEAEEQDPLKSGMKLASEYIVPGGSNLLEGDLAQGAIHAVLGIVARSVFGLPGLIAVSANSFTKATTGRHIHEHLGLGIGQQKKEQTSYQDARAEIEASSSSQSALIPQPPPVSQTSAPALAQKKQPSSKKRPSSSKTSKES
ncbi:MAG: DUF6072 family protein [Blastocatellia bacterium]